MRIIPPEDEEVFHEIPTEYLEMRFAENDMFFDEQQTSQFFGRFVSEDTDYRKKSDCFCEQCIASFPGIWKPLKGKPCNYQKS